MQIAGIPAHVQPQLGRRGKVTVLEGVGQLAKPGLPLLGGLFLRLRLAEELPIARRRGVREGSGQLDPRAEKAGFEVIQGPFIIGQKAKVGLDVLERELPGGLVGLGNGPNQAALAQGQGIDLKLAP